MGGDLKLDLMGQSKTKCLRKRDAYMNIQPDGAEDAQIVIIGESPSKDDIISGVPFSGSQGELLFDDILARAGIFRKDCLVLHTYTKQAPGNKLDIVSDPFERSAEHWKLIQKHPRKLIIAVGEYALRFLCNESGITKWRGSLLYSNRGKIPVIPMIAPVSIIRQYSWLVLCRKDALKAKRVLTDFDSIVDHKRNIVHYGQIKKDHATEESGLITKILIETLKSYHDAPCLAFDIETYAECITCVGVARSATEAVVIPFTTHLSHEDRIALIRELNILLSNNALKVGQNLDYDAQYLAKNFGICVRNVWMDTMVAHSVMHPEMGHSLDLLASIYTNKNFYKEMRKEATSGNYNNTLWEYNGIDCCVTYEVAVKLSHELISTHAWEFFHNVAMPVTKTLIRMEHKGVHIDENLRSKRKESLSNEMADLLADDALCGVNPNSPKQVLDYFKSKGVRLPISRGRKTASTDVHTLKLLRPRQPKHHAFIDKCLAVRDRRKIIGTYLEAKVHKDGRMRTSYRTSATDTGRISSSKDVFNKGMNLQNIPGDQRDWFVPDPGLVFWEADGSQIEARITAYVAGDVNYKQGFIEGRDIHSENAIALFKIPASDVRNPVVGTHYTYRDIGKRASHAINYMVGPGKLKDLMNEYVPNMKFSLNDARRFIDSFKTLRPGIHKWWISTIQHLKTNRVMRTPYGRQRVFLDRWGDQLHRAAVAFVPQSTAADHINAALARIELRLESLPEASVLLQVHDSVAGQCKPEDLEHVRSIVCEEMEKPIPKGFGYYWEDELVIPADFASGSNWKSCK